MENQVSVERDQQGRYGMGPVVEESPPFRVEIKENAKGEPYVGGLKATGDTPGETVKKALEMYNTILETPRFRGRSL